MNSSVKFVVIPAAGIGSRWAPLSTFVPKELLPLGGIPVIELVVREAMESGCSDAVLIISKKKKLLKNYLKSIKVLRGGIKLHFVYQEKSLGVADAVHRAKKIIGHNNFAVIFPDMPAHYKVSPLTQMIKVFESLSVGSHVMPFAKYPENNMLFYGEFFLKKREEGLYDVLHLCPKAKDPSERHHQESNLRAAGRYIFSPTIFPLIEKVLKEVKGREVWDGDFLDLAFELGHKIVGLEVNAFMFDTGTPASYTKANWYMQNFLKPKK